MQTLITKAQQIRDAQVTLATHAPTVTPPPAPLAPVGPITAAEMQARFDRIDFDGNGTLNTNDFQQMQNEYAACTSWAAMTPTNLQASVQGQQVILSWVGGINADTIEVIRDNVTVQTLAGSATTYTDSPGPGAHSWMTRASGTLGSANIYQGKLSNAVTATVQGTVPVSGWTDLTPASGGVVVYVSSSTGNDSNTGTQTAPFRTLAHGYQALRDGHPDQLLLKCGDTWTEGLSWQKGGASGAPMVMASYGTGARPAIRGGIYGGQQNKGWVIFADLDVQPAGGVGTAGNAFLFFAPWHDITIEGNYIAGFNVNIVVQEVDASRSQNIRIRRNVIADAAGGSGHNQGLFMGSCDGTVIEENVFDLNGNYPGFEKADMFCHSCYLHETNGPSTFNGNITARACSHGVQQRSGGLMTENLALQNPIDLFQGNASNVSNSFTLNVAIDSRDINPATPRGIGFELYCPVGSVVLNNVAAKNISGTQNTDAFSIAGTATVKFNAVNDWKQPVSPRSEERRVGKECRL